MTAIMNPRRTGMMEAAPRSIVANSVSAAPGIENKPIAGGEINIKVALTPGMVMLLASPVAVGVVMGLGWVVLTSMGMALYGREMVAGGIVAVVGGTLAALPVTILMKRGVMAIMQASLLSMMIRCGAILMGLLLAMGPGWALDKMPLAVWSLCFYFPLLIVETSCIAWLANKSSR